MPTLLTVERTNEGATRSSCPNVNSLRRDPPAKPVRAPPDGSKFEPAEGGWKAVDAHNNKKSYWPPWLVCLQNQPGNGPRRETFLKPSLPPIPGEAPSPQSRQLYRGG